MGRGGWWQGLALRGRGVGHGVRGWRCSLERVREALRGSAGAWRGRLAVRGGGSGGKGAGRGLTACARWAYSARVAGGTRSRYDARLVVRVESGRLAEWREWCRVRGVGVSAMVRWI